MSNRIRVRDFEAAFLQVLAVIEYRSADKERALWIDNETDVRGRNENVAFFRAVHHSSDASLRAAFSVTLIRRSLPIL